MSCSASNSTIEANFPADRNTSMMGVGVGEFEECGDVSVAMKKYPRLAMWRDPLVAI